MSLFGKVGGLNAVAGNEDLGYSTGDWNTRTTNNEIDYNTDPQWELDFGNRFEAGVQESFATLWGGLGMMSDIVGLDSAKEYTMKRSNELFEKAADHDFQRTGLKDINWSSPEGITDVAKFLTEGVIGVVPDIAGTMLGGAGVATGLARLSGKAIVKKSLKEGAKKSLLKNLAKARTKGYADKEAQEYAYKKSLKEIGGMAGVGGYTAATGSGGMYSTDYNMNGDDTSPFSALGGGVAQGAVTLFNPFSKVLAGIAAKKGVKEIGSMAIGEAMEEVSQGAMEKLHLAGIDPNLTVEQIFNDPDTYWQLAEAGILGAFVGGVFGGIGTTLNSKEEAQKLIEDGEKTFGGSFTEPSMVTPEGSFKEGISTEQFKKDWKIAEAKMGLTNKAPADNATIQSEMAKGAEGTITEPILASPEPSMQEVSSKYVKDSNRVSVQPSFTEMTGGGTVLDTIRWIKNSDINTEMDTLVEAYKAERPSIKDKRQIDKIINSYIERKDNTPSKSLDDAIANVKGIKLDSEMPLDSLDSQPTGMAIQEGMEQTSMSPEEAMIAREDIAQEERTMPSKSDEPTIAGEPSKGVEVLLEGTPDASIAYVASYGNPRKTLAALKEEASSFVDMNPHTAVIVDENLQAIEKDIASRENRGVARDVKGAVYKWEPYTIGDIEYGEWLQTTIGDQKYVLLKSPEHGNKYIISKDGNKLDPISNSDVYKTKREGKEAFEKLLGGKSTDVQTKRKSTKGKEKPLSYTKTGEMDKDGIPIIKSEGKGVYRSSDGKYKIENTKPNSGHGKFYLSKGDEQLNNGVPYKSLKDATKAYKGFRSTDASALKVKEKKSGKPKIVAIKKSKVDDAKDKRMARKRDAELELLKQKDNLSKDIRVNKKELAEIHSKTTMKNISSSSVDRDPTKLNVHPDISGRVAKYIKAYMEYLGIDYKGMYIMPLQKGKDVSVPTDVHSEYVDTWNSKKDSINGLYSPSNNVLGIKLEGRSDPEILETLNHELFHKFKSDIFDKMPKSAREDLIIAHKAWAASVSSIKPIGKEALTKIYRMVLEPVRGSKLEGQTTDRSMLTEDEMKYLLSFDEFFATQGAKWSVLDAKSKSMASDIFAKVKEFFWKIYSIYAKGAQVTNKPLESFNKFMKVYMANQKIINKAQLADIDFTGIDTESKEVGQDGKSKSPVKKRTLKENKKFISSKDFKKAKTDRTVDKWKEKVFKTIDDLIQPISERLGEIHVKLPVFMREMERKLNMYNNKYLREVQPYVEKFKKLDKDTQELLTLYLHNTNIEEDYQVGTKMLKDLGMYEDYKKVEGILDKVYDRSEAVGLNIFKKKEHYFPRRVKDIKGLMKYINEEGVDAGPLNIIIENENLSDVQKNEMIMQAINTNRLPESALKATTASNKRSINRVDAEMSKFYEGHIDSLINHIYESNQRIEAHALLGKTNSRKLTRRVNKLSKQLKVAKDKKDTVEVKKLTEAIEKDLRAIQDIGDATAISEDSVSSFLNQQGVELKDKDQRLAIELIRSRLNQKGMHGLAGDIRNIGLVTALGSYLNTITQIGDLPWVIYKYGLKNASQGIFGKKEISMEDLDLTQALKEFSQEGTSKYVDKVLKATGFEWLDQFAKRSSMQASLEQVRGMTKEEFTKKNKELYGAERASRMYEDILAGKKSDDMVQYVFNELSGIQPISLSEMPSKYLTAGNGRIFYSLKSYGMKQLSNIRREGLGEYRKGNKTGAFKNMMRLVPLLVLSNASIDELKDWILGKDEPFEDHVMDNLLKLAFMSRYTLDKGTRDGIASSVIKDLISPPGIRLADTFMKDIGNVLNGEKDATYKSMENIPLLGKILYKRVTPQGREKEFDMRRRSIREDIRGAIKGGDSMNSIRSRIAKYNKELPSGMKRVKYSIISEVRRDLRRKEIERLRG